MSIGHMRTTGQTHRTLDGKLAESVVLAALFGDIRSLMKSPSIDQP
jgi:hypothetical protein